MEAVFDIMKFVFVPLSRKRNTHQLNYVIGNLMPVIPDLH
jgi:hypothetical protein